MPGWLYTDGHLGWALFAALVYTGAGVLVGDYVWRRVTIPAKLLLAAAVGVWVLGLIGLSVALRG
ncbi:hypothetical protein ACS8Y6_09860 [Salinisphaera sp. RV14]|uniref:hypothetical protein n=1 Tax=unclassified Salinisphaera TaxID=2649847 RepID=UPI003F864FA6